MSKHEDAVRTVKTHKDFRDPKNFRLSKRAKTIYALNRTPRTTLTAFRNLMVNAESFATTVEKVVYDKLVPNVSGYGRAIAED